MTVQARRGILSRIRKYSGGVIIQVRHASDPDRAAEALRSAQIQILRLRPKRQSSGVVEESPLRYMSPIFVTPDGPCFWFDGAHAPDELLAAIPDVVRTSLIDAEISEATIDVPEYEKLIPDLRTIPNAVFMRAYPPLPGRRSVRAEAPSSWVDAACDWIEGDGKGVEAIVRMGPIQLRVPASEARSFLEASARPAEFAGEIRPCFLFIGDPSQRIRTCGLYGSWRPNVVLAWGGPGATHDDLVERISILREVAERLAPGISYAFVEFFGSFGDADRWDQETDWIKSGEGPRPEFLHDVIDQVIPDAFHFQVLSQKHLDRLGGTPAGARPLGNGRVVVEVGQPRDWLRASARRAAVRRDARRLLGPCLLNSGETLATVQSIPV